MYSVVLATMLTAGAQSTTWCHRARCHGCSGCHYNAFSVCHGCHSYCSGYYCGGCSCSGWSRCHGCHSSYSYGCHSCHYSNGCHGCHWCSGVVVVHGCHACHCSGVRVIRHRERDDDDDDDRRDRGRSKARDDDDRGKSKSKDKGRNDDDEEVAATSPARVIVKLPAQARLWVDQVPCPLEGTVRAFDTPELQPGQRYFYTLRMEVERNGQRVQESRRVPFVAGQRVEVDFNSAVRTAQN
jgi:uncharacterized protein (TIGR03000 family)